MTLFICRFLGEVGVVHWLEGGTLMGAVREGGQLLAWEDDTDVSFQVTEQGEVAPGMSLPVFYDVLRQRVWQAGYECHIDRNFNHIYLYFTQPYRWPWCYEHYRHPGQVHLDLVAYFSQQSEHGIHLCRGTPVVRNDQPIPAELVLPTSRIAFCGVEVSAPCQPRQYLQFLYGNIDCVEYTYLQQQQADRRRMVDKVSCQQATNTLSS